MPNITQRTVRTTQPQTAVGIDYANPITRGLVACIDANRRVLINGSETRPLTLTNPVRRASQQEFGTVTLQTTMQAIKAPPATSSNVTMLSIFIPATEITERTYGQLGQTGTGNMLSVSSGDGATAGVVRFKIYLGSMRAIGASQANEGVPNLAIARHINGQSQNLWLNGVKDAASGAFTGNSIGFGFYGFSQGSGAGGVSILNAVWNRALTDAEIKSLSENPWQIFAPERRAIAFDAVVASGGDAVNLTVPAANNSYTSATLQVTQLYKVSATAISNTYATASAEVSQKHLAATESLLTNTQSNPVSVSQRYLMAVPAAAKSFTLNGVTLPTDGQILLSVAAIASMYAAAAPSMLQKQLLQSSSAVFGASTAHLQVTQKQVVVASSVTAAKSSPPLSIAQKHKATLATTSYRATVPNVSFASGWPALVKRLSKGSPLTYQELDNNFQMLLDRIIALENGI
jgi:hypothetical protein